MTDKTEPPELSAENNRFERWYQNIKTGGSGWGRKLRTGLFVGLIVLFAAEVTATILAVRKLETYGVPFDVAAEHFWLTNLTIYRVMDTPNIDHFENSTGTEYIGFEQHCWPWSKTDALLGWRNLPGISCSFLYPEGGVEDGAGLMWAANDANGFVVSRDNAPPAHEREKKPGVFRIIALGGSTMASLGTAPYDSIPGILQRYFDEHGAPPGYDSVEMINAGSAAYASAQEYMYLLSELIYYKPDIVLMYDGWNDSQNRHGHFSNAVFAKNRKRAKFGGVPFSATQMKTHRDYGAIIDDGFTVRGAFRILRNALKRKLNPLTNNTGIGYWRLKPRLAKAFSLTDPERAKFIREDHDPRVLDVYRENVERGIRLAELEGFNIAYVLQPVLGVATKPYAEGREQNFMNTIVGQAKAKRRQDFYKIVRPLHDELRADYAHMDHVCFRDISNVFADETETVYVDEGHLNVLGNEIVSAALLKEFRSCGFLPN